MTKMGIQWPSAVEVALQGTLEKIEISTRYIHDIDTLL